MSFGFTKAVRSRRKLKAAFDGVSGSGKTFSALRLAFSLVRAGMGTNVAVIDSENESASLYANESPDGIPWEYDTLNLKSFSPDQYVAAMNLAFKSGYDVVVVDSLSHAWNAEGGALDLVDKKGGNKFAAWKDVTPLHRKMVDTIINAPAHVIVTMRSKTEYVMEQDEKGKSVPRKVGMAPVQRDGMEYEFDVYTTVDQTHQARVTKSRCSAIDGATGIKPGPQFWQPLFDWLNSATASAAAAFAEPPPPVTESQLKEIAAARAKYLAAKGVTGGEQQTEAWAAVLIPFGVGSAKQLTRDQAVKFLADLQAATHAATEKILTQAVTVSAAHLAGGFSVVSPLAAEPPAATATAEPPRITHDQIEELKKLRSLVFAALPNGTTDDEKAAKWREVLAPHGCTSVLQLTESQAAAVVEDIGKRYDPFGHPTPSPQATG